MKEPDRNRRQPRDRGPPGLEIKHGRCCRIDRAGHQTPLVAYEGTSAVLHITDLSADRNAWFHLVRRVTGWLRTVGDRIFAANDAEAGWWGWTATRRSAGLSRTYRDPRFRSLMPCPRCDGSGEHDGEDGCRLCDGTGRLERHIRTDSGGVRW